MKFIVHILVVALALAATAYIVPAIQVDSLTTLLVAALVLGVVNAIVRPILAILTLPITVVTLGLFLFVVNGLAFALAAWFVPGFSVDGFWWCEPERRERVGRFSGASARFSGASARWADSCSRSCLKPSRSIVGAFLVSIFSWFAGKFAGESGS